MRIEISTLFDTDTLSDLTITCGSQKFSIHRVILYTQSGYFRKLFGGPFKEADTTHLDLPDDDLNVLRVLLCYFYKSMLDTTFPLDPIHLHNGGNSAFLIRVYAIANKYDVPRLRSLVVQRLTQSCGSLKNETDFIEALGVVDECTAENAIWDVLLPKVKANMHTLLGNRLFKEVVLEQSTMAFQLLADLGSNEQQFPPSKKQRTSDQSASGRGSEDTPSNGARRGREVVTSRSNGSSPAPAGDSTPAPRNPPSFQSILDEVRGTRFGSNPRPERPVRGAGRR